MRRPPLVPDPVTTTPFDAAALRRREFAWMDEGDSVYLNAASVGPLPASTVSALEEFTRKRAQPHLLSFEEQFGALTSCREHIATLIGAAVEEIALTTNTAAGINLAAFGLPLGPGDVVLVPDGEFPANVYPWLAAARSRGFDVRLVPMVDGLLDTGMLLSALDTPNVRVLAVSWVGFSTGVVADLDLLGNACRARGITFVVDAIQGLGALTIDVSRTPIDLLTCGAQKWLLSPWGTAFMRVSPALLERIEPQPVSWMSVRSSDDFTTLLDYDLTWREDARRFEQVTLPFQDFAGAARSLALLNELGPSRVSAHIVATAAALMDGLAERGHRVVTLRSPHAGIVSFAPDVAADASAALTKAGVAHSVRQGTIRLAPHCYTIQDDIQRALHALG